MWLSACVVLLMAVSMNCYVVDKSDGEAEDAKNICCTPKQWEGYLGEIGSVRYKYHRFHYLEGSCIHYDGVGQRVAAHAHIAVEEGHRSAEVKVLLSFRAKKMYIVYGKKQDRCKVRAIKHPFRAACIPASAKKVGSTHLGAGKAQLGVTAYNLHRKGFGVSVTVSEGCIPISEVAFVDEPSKRLKVFADIGFYGITAGIKDKKVFDVPKACQHAEEYPEVDGDTLQFKDQTDDLIQYFMDMFTEE